MVDPNAQPSFESVAQRNDSAIASGVAAIASREAGVVLEAARDSLLGLQTQIEAGLSPEDRAYVEAWMGRTAGRLGFDLVPTGEEIEESEE